MVNWDFNLEMTVVGQLASRWNTPIIAHLSGADYLSNHSIFSTLGSVALTSAHEMARATFSLLHFYGWKKVCFWMPCFHIIGH